MVNIYQINWNLFIVLLWKVWILHYLWKIYVVIFHLSWLWLHWPWAGPKGEVGFKYRPPTRAEKIHPGLDIQITFMVCKNMWLPVDLPVKKSKTFLFLRLTSLWLSEFKVDNCWIWSKMSVSFLMIWSTIFAKTWP